MAMQQIMEILNKIASDDGKIRFLEKCLFEEKSPEAREEILSLIRKLAKKRVSIEDRIRQLEKEKMAPVVEEVAVQAKAKVSKEAAKPVKKVKLETELEQQIMPASESPAVSLTQQKDYLTKELNDFPKAGAEESYRQKSEEKSYIQMENRDAEYGRYLQRGELSKSPIEREHVSEEEYKRSELIRLGKEKRKKLEEYTRQIDES